MRKRRYTNVDPIKTITVDGTKFDIHVDSDGEFRCHVEGDFLRSDTLKALLPQIKRAAKKKHINVAIPATIMGVSSYTEGSHYHRKYLGETCLPITLIGIDHQYNRVKYRNADGSMAGHERFNRQGTIAKPMTAADVQEWKRLYQAHESARKAFESFESKFEMKNVMDTVKDAIAQKADTVIEPPDESNVDPRDRT